MNYTYTTFRIIVKGSMADCLAAIEYRGLTAIGCVQIDRQRSCAIDVESCHEYLTSWFDEPTECVQFVGFPVGTLLSISQHRNYTKPLAQLV